MLGQHTKKCGNTNCLFTDDRNYQDHPNLQAFLFYGSHINVTDVPLPRKNEHIWALLHEESPKNIPFILFEPAITLFNITSTFSRYSNLPLTLQYLRHAKDITTKRHWRTVEEKNALQIHDDLAPVLYMQSICDTLSFRDDYVKKLGAFIKIDSYGKCLNNKTLPKYLQENYIEKLFDDELLRFIARYKFIIAYENGLCEDYISEKLWRALIVGVVPLYFGTKTVKVSVANIKFREFLLIALVFRTGCPIPNRLCSSKILKVQKN
jgi:alpha-1,3-fucosyltransferase 10